MKKRVFSPILALSALLLSACSFDLGNAYGSADNYDQYYASFGKLTSLYDGGSHEYDIEDSLFNNLTVNSFSWEKNEYKVVPEQYLYLILPLKAQLKITSIALYAYAEESAEMEVSAFYFLNKDDLDVPEKIKYLSPETSPDTEPIYDDDGNIIGEKEIEYDDPPVEKSIIHDTAELPRQTWTSFVMSGFRQEGYEDNNLHTGQDGLLYLRIENNSGHNRDRLSPVTFSFTNLLIRSVTND